jgi:hypothetical protein
VTKEQRDGILAVLPHSIRRSGSPSRRQGYPIEWTAARIARWPKLDGGKAGEVVLKRNQGMTDDRS